MTRSDRPHGVPVRRKHREASVLSWLRVFIAACRVNVEKDYREPRDYDVDNFPDNAPCEQLHGFQYLQNRDGIWRNSTTAVYGYEPASKCPQYSNSENIYCDMDIDPRRPEGVCVTKTKFFCLETPPVDFDRGNPYVEAKGGGATVIQGPIQKGLHGDRRSICMSLEEGLDILRLPLGHAGSCRACRRNLYHMRQGTTELQLDAEHVFSPGSLRHF
ncbi:uncharacterized protein LOC127831847 [Dreissena polymorpha]|nr:uncharacterized protein LOC127831847 [Dreissena polymorpha]